MASFYPHVGLRVLHVSGNKGTIRTVHFGRDGAGGSFAKGGEGYIEFDNYEGGEFCSFVQDVVSVLSDGELRAPSFVELLHVGELVDA